LILLLTFRNASSLCAGILGAYCLWLLVPEFGRSDVNNLPTNPQDAAIAAEQRATANTVASIGMVRGDLWAHAAFTFANLMWSGPSGAPADVSERAHDRLERAVRFAPAQTDTWLLVAGLSLRDHWAKVDPQAVLTMSYYTGPAAENLMALRLSLAAQLPNLDSELQRLAQRDLRLMAARQQKPAIIGAYRLATPAGKELIERGLGDSDPGFVESLRHGDL
jgi:hypothetical protein